MSASAPTRRSWWRRALRAAMVLGAGLALLVVLAVIALQTSPGRNAARALLESWGSRATGGQLRLGGLDLRLWQRRASVTAATLRLPGVTIEAPLIEADWSPRHGVHVRASRPRVVVVETGEPKPPRREASGLLAQPWRVLEKLGRAEVLDGRLELQDEKGAPWLALEGIGLETTEGGGRRTALRVDDAAVGFPGGGLRLRALRLDAALHLDGGRLAVEQARITSSSSSVTLSGRLDRILPVNATASAHAAVDGALVAALAPGMRVTGRVEADLAADASADRVTGTLAATSEAMGIAGTGPWSVSGRGRLEGLQLVIDSVVARGFGGRVEASGPLALVASARTDVHLRVEDLDAAALARGPGGTAPPVATRASGSLHWSTTGWDVEAAHGEGQVTLRATEGRGLKASGGASLSLRGSRLAIEEAHVEAHDARLTANLVFGKGGIGGHFAGDLPIRSLPALLADLGSSARVPEVDGRLLAQGDVTGSISDPVVQAHVAGEGLAARGHPLSLEADARYEQRGLLVAPLVVRSGAGQAELSGRIPLTKDDHWDLAGKADAFEMEPLLVLLGLDGRGTVEASLRLTGQRDEPVGHVAARAEALVRRPRAAQETPEDGVVLELEASTHGRRVEVQRLQADLAGGRLEGTGRYDARTGALEGGFEASDLALDRLPLVPTPARRITGTLAGRLSLTGTLAAPAGELLLTLSEAALDGAPLPSLSIEAHADGRELRVAGKAEAAFLKGTARVDGDWPAKIQVDTASLPVQALLGAWPAARQAQTSVAATGTIAIELDLRHPAGVRYSSSDLAASGRVRNLDWGIAPFAMRGDLESVTLDGLRIKASRTSLSARGRVAFAPTAPLDLKIESDVDLADLENVFPGRRFDGKGALDIEAKGTLKEPQLHGSVHFTDVQGRVEGAHWSDLNLTARLEGRELQVDGLTAKLLGGTVEARGSLPLAREAADATAPFAFDLRDLDVGGLLESPDAAAPPVLLSLEGEVRTRALSLDGLTARGRVTRFETGTGDGTLALAAPAPWSFGSGTLEVPPFRLEGPAGTLEVRADARTRPGPRWSAAVAGGVDLGVLNAFLPNTTFGGPARLDVRVLRENDAYRLEGSAKVEAARLSLDTFGFVATELTGDVRFEGDRVALEATSVSGDGRIRARGGMRLGPKLLGAADLTLDAERVPLQYPPGYRGRVSGSLNLTGTPGRYRLGGAVSLSQGYYTAELDSKTQSLDRLDWQLGALEGGTLTDQIALDMKVRFAEPVRVRNRKMRLDAEGVISVTGTLAQPAAGGDITLREGGELTLGRGRLRVSRGRLDLNGYPGGTPTVDFQGATRVSGVAIEAQARGPLDDLQLTLSSDRSDLSQTDLVSLLMTGRTAATAASQSGAVVAEELASSLGGALQKGVGDAFLIDVSPDHSLLTNDTDPTQRFNIGTRLSQNMMVIYSAALDGTDKRWIVEFNPGGGRFRLRTIAEEDNSFSFEGSDRVSFDLWSHRGAGRSESRETERLADLRFEGTLPVPEKDLRKATKLKRRRRCSGLQREQAADRVRKLLAEKGYRGAVVDVESETVSRGVDVVLRVEPGPRVTIEWQGDDPGKGPRKAAEQAWPAVAAPDVAAATIARAALVRLQAEGYYTAKVDPEVKAGEGRVDLRLRVSRGPKGRGVEIDLEGNNAVDDATLRAALPKAGSLEMFEALDPRSTRISNDVRLAYASRGYLRARVGKPRTALDEASGRLTVTIPIRERGPSFVASVELPDEAAQASDLKLRLKADEPFDLGAYLADRDAVGAWYRAQGFVEAQVGGVIEARGQTVAVRYMADVGPRPRVAAIRVEQAGKTRESLIRRSLPVHEGDLVRPEALAEGRERLAELGIFRTVDVRTEPHADDPASRDVIVSVVEKSDVQLEYGLRYTTTGQGGAAGGAPSSPENARIQVAGALELTNPFGFGVKARVYGFTTTDRQSVGVNLDSATFLGHRVRTQLFVFDDRDQDVQISGVTSNVKGTTLQQSYVLLRDRRSRRRHDRLRLQWGYTFKIIDYVESVEEKLVIHGNRGFASLAAIGDERDSLTEPTKGVFWTATTELARTALGSDVNYVRLYGQIFGYVSLGPLVWAQGFRVGVVPGADPLLLIENRFHAGGPTTVRGFEQNGLGPRTAAGDSLGGQAVAIFNQELRFPIWKSLKGGAFWDAGNVWLTASEFHLGDVRQSVGAGLRYSLPFGPIRVEYAWILGRRAGEAPGRFVFGLGHAF